MLKKEDRQELKRFREELAKAKPGTPEYEKLLEQRIKFGDALSKESDATRLIPGVKNDTLTNGILAGVEVFTLTGILDKFLVNKSLLTFLPKFHVKL